MLKFIKISGFILSPLILVFLYVYISSSGLFGKLPKDGELVYSPRPVGINEGSVKQIFFGVLI